MRDCRSWLCVVFVLGLVCGMVVGVLVVVASPANAEDAITHIHSSSRFDRSAASLHREAVRFSGADVVTWTEVSARGRKRALRVPGWQVWAPVPTDVAVSFRVEWRVVAKGVFRPTRLWSSGPLPRVFVAWMVLQRAGLRVLVMVSHLPSGVEWGRHWRGASSRVSQWQAAVRGWGVKWRRLVARFGPDVSVLTADWNVDVRLRVWRHRVVRSFPGLSLSWRRPFPQGGTLGRRLVDASLSDWSGRARLLRDDRSSDHRPFREVLRG